MIYGYPTFAAFQYLLQTIVVVRWWFQFFVDFTVHPYWAKSSDLIDNFEMGRNHQLANFLCHVSDWISL